VSSGSGKVLTRFQFNDITAFYGCQADLLDNHYVGALQKALINFQNKIFPVINSYYLLILVIEYLTADKNDNFYRLDS